jgi:hypothetical protein
MIILIVSVFSRSALVASDSTIIPTIGEGGTVPTIDGNLTSFDTEWLDSVILNTTISGYDTSIRILSDETNLYIGFNYTSVNYVPVNGTSYNATSDQNLDTHDWVALQIDNNLDQKIYGSASNPDDVLVVDQFNSSAYDGYVNGSSSAYFADTIVNGTDDGDAISANVTVGADDHLVYEFIKPHDAADKNGSDYNLNRRILQFRISLFFNTTSNSSLSKAASSQWFSMRINETGTGIALETVGNTTISINIVGDNTDGMYSGLNTSLALFGFDTEVVTNNFSLNEDVYLNIFIISENSAISDDQFDELRSYLGLGGRAIFFLSNASTSVSDDVAEKFNMDFLPNEILDNNETLLQLTANDLVSMPYLGETSLTTNTTVSAMTLTSSAFNTSSSYNKTENPYVYFQDYHMYDLFNPTFEIAYNTTEEQIVSDDISLGVSFDLLKGGRITLFPSTSMVSADYLTVEDNLIYLLRLLPWNSRIVNTLQVNSVEINSHHFNVTDQITVTANVTDEYGANVSATVVSSLHQATAIVDISELTGSVDIYTGTLNITEDGSMTVKTYAFQEGYGYAEGTDKQLFVEEDVSLGNELSDLNVWLILIFLATIAIVVYIIIKTK